MYFEKNVLTSLLVVLAVSFQTAHSLECIKCKYDSQMPSAQQVCNNSVVETCTFLSTYCDSSVYIKGSTTHYNKGCATVFTCGDPAKFCDSLKRSPDYKACEVTCCQSNSCNNNKFPSLNGVDHTKVGQASFIMALVAAILFA